MHLATIHNIVATFKPRVLVMDPLTNLISVGDREEVKSMLTRLIDLFKTEQIIALFTSLTLAGDAPEQSEVGISSLMDTWILLRNLEQGGERNRGLYILKSRGMVHSNQIREFRLSRKGIELIEVSVADGAVLTGGARLAQEARERAEAEARRQQAARLERVIQRKERSTQAQISVLRAALENDLEELKQGLAEETLRSSAAILARKKIARNRMATANGEPANRNRAGRVSGTASDLRGQNPSRAPHRQGGTTT